MPHHKEKPGENFLKIDSHAEPVTFNIDGGQTKFKTRVGSVLTLLEIGTLLWFAASKISIMAAKTSTSISTNTFFPDQTQEYGVSSNFTFAYGISGWASGSSIDLTNYISLSVVYNTWVDEGNMTTTPIKTRPCTAEDFGIDGVPRSDNSKFY